MRIILCIGLVAALMGIGVSANEDGLALETFCRRAFATGAGGLCWWRLWRCMLSRGGCPLHGTERQSSKMKKSQIAGILFGVAMGVLFSVSLGTVGFALGASFANLGMVMFQRAG